PTERTSTLFPYTTLFRSYLEDAIKALQGATKVILSREGVISVKAEDTDAEVAAQIANFYVEQLDHLLDIEVGDLRSNLCIHVLGDRKSTRLNSSHVAISY